MSAPSWPCPLPITHPSASRWPAPAKLNLFLHITGRREDGYHLLQTVFQFLDYGDTLYFTPRDDGQIRRLTDLPGVAEAEDLVVRAARTLQKVSGCSLGVDISVDKRLPMGGGLGGGSSDAATTLVALNRIWSLGLDVETLAQLGLALGADVPVFIRGHAAWAEGVGDILTPVELDEPWFVVLIPGVNVSTAEIFNDPQLTRATPAIKIRDFLAGQGSNVCQEIVVKHYPAVAEAIEWLGRHGKAMMTGTGACVFAAFETQRQAAAAFAARPQRWEGFIAKGLNRSPLLDRLDNTEI
ncbi:MAG: 4-(cytidine 5'-diphospho)-2-C-methyl-D-erythritol kinase [Gammaproteobacteria bacterium]|nr:4-(cytidine 5'-diphospho)-2-C-methyl-D-erythritol kinase [Gammaproteobacteria bacterium]